MEQYFQLEDMEYKRKRGEYPVLAFGVHKGRRFFIISVGGEWPAAYVESKEGEPVDYRILDSGIQGDAEPHGGLTYGPSPLMRLKKCLEGYGISDEILSRSYWGWDYGHYSDYCTWVGDYGSYGDETLKKWTVEEIYEEDVVPFIEWLSEKYAPTKKE